MHAHHIPEHEGQHRSPGAAAAALLATVVVASSALLVRSPAPAAAGTPVLVTISVQTTADVVDPADGVRSLREAFDEANADGVHSEVSLAQGATYLLDECAGGTDENLNVGGDLDHTEDTLLHLDGNGSTIEQTCDGERVLHDWDPDAEIAIYSVRITGGETTGSGGGVMAGGSVAVFDSVVEGNSSSGPNGGGGVAANLQADIFTSTIRGNVAAGRGGGVRSNEFIGMSRSTIVGNSSGASGGGVSAGTKANLRASTITGNEAAVSGGGASSASDDLELGGDTVVANRAPLGANAHADEAVVLFGTVIGLGSGGVDCASGSPVENQGGNAGFDPSCGPAQADDHAAMHPMVSVLTVGNDAPGSLLAGDESMPITPGSPSLDLYAAPCASVHQHGGGRPEGPACDSGSFEGAPDPCTPTFNDVSAAHPFFEEICWLADSGITSGYGDGSFGAGQAVSRQAMAAFLYRLALEPPVPLSLVAFSDVDSDHPFADEIIWLVEEDISQGYGDGTFRPNDPVTRQAMAAFLYRIAGEPPVVMPAVPTFPDVPLTHPFAEEIEWMADAGVSTGYEDGTWHPGSSVTRQAMAAFLLRMAEDVHLRGL